MSDHPQTQLYIGDVWRDGSNERLSIVDPASDEIIGTVANAGRDDLDEALAPPLPVLTSGGKSADSNDPRFCAMPRSCYGMGSRKSRRS